MPDTTQFQTTLDDQVVQSMVNLILVIAAGFAVYVGGTLLLWAIRHRRARHVDEILHAVTHNPPLLPAHAFDASDTTPWSGINTPTYCPSCWVIWNNETMTYAVPDGEPVFCFEHKYTPLHRAYVERTFIQEATR